MSAANHDPVQVVRNRQRRTAVRALFGLLALTSIFCIWPLVAAGSADATTITVSLSPSTILANRTDTTTVTATVTQGAQRPVAGDTVTFASSDREQTITPGSAVTGADGVATATLTSSTTVGTSTVIASDASGSSNPADLTQTVGPATTMTLSVSPSTIVADGFSTSTATATVSDAQGHPIDNDPVQFSSSDPGQLVSATLRGSNHTYTATIRSSTTPGRTTITASDGATLSKQTTLVQASGPTRVSLVTSQSTAATNEAIALWANVSASGGQPAGALTFYGNGAVLPGCAGEPISPTSTVATCRASFSAAGSPVELTATFVPAPGSTAARASASTVLRVTRASSSVELSTPASTRVGQRTTYVADVSPSPAGGPTTPSGSVAFFDNGQQISGCRAVNAQGGRATCAVTYRSAGSHAITAQYPGDANFTGSEAGPRVVKVVLPAPRGAISATMQWTFRYTPRYTTVLQFGVSGATNTAVTIACRGRGCPFGSRTVAVRRTQRCGRGLTHTCLTRGRTDLTRYFRGRRLGPGATITVVISRKLWIGKHYTFTMRTRRGPAVAISCMAPGATRPGVGCST
jgi:hypothetical protein